MGALRALHSCRLYSWRRAARCGRVTGGTALMRECSGPMSSCGSRGQEGGCPHRLHQCNRLWKQTAVRCS